MPKIKVKKEAESPVITSAMQPSPKPAETGYLPSSAQQDIINKLWTRFVEMRDMRDQPFRFFNDRTLIEILDEAQERFNLYLRPREDPEEWQTRYVNPITRNKVIAICARLAGQRMKRSWFGTTEDNKWKARVCKVLDENAAYINNEDMAAFFRMLSAVVKGKVVVYEGYSSPIVEMYEITSYDPATGDIKFKINKVRDHNDVINQIVPLEDFYPGNLRARSVNDPKMKDCGWGTRMSIEDFQAEFYKYPNCKYVKRGGEARTMPQYKNFLPTGLLDNEVFVWRYFKKPTNTPDTMGILANGVLMTPDVSPLPWNHKKKRRGLPFWDAGMEPYDEEFFYCMPMPIKLKGDSDVTDAVMRMQIDLLYLLLNPPILSEEAENIEDKRMGPGVVWDVTSVEGTKSLEMKGPAGDSFNMLKVLANNMNLSTIDNVQQGIGNQGNPTATEVDAAVEGASQLLDLFKQFMEWGSREQGVLQISNQLQFYPVPLGLDDNKKPKYRTLRVDNVPKIMDGKIGSVKLTFVSTKSDLPPTPPLSDEQRQRFVEQWGEDFDQIVCRQSPNNKNLEEVWMTAAYMKDFDAGCTIVPNSSVKQSEAMKRAMEERYQQHVLTFYPDLVDRSKLYRTYAEINEHDPDEVMLEQPANPQNGTVPSGLPQGLDSGLNNGQSPTASFPGGQGSPTQKPPVQATKPTVNQIIKGR